MAEELDNDQLEDEGSTSTPPSSSNEHIDLKTHNLINQSLCGTIEELSDGYAKVRFITTDEMVVDKKGLIHAGFIFCGANFAAMAAVNKPSVVLAVARCNFLSAIALEDEVIFEAHSKQATSRKRTVSVVGTLNGLKIFEADFSVVVLDKHVLNLNLTDR